MTRHQFDCKVVMESSYPNSDGLGRRYHSVIRALDDDIRLKINLYSDEPVADLGRKVTVIISQEDQT